jgi:hypothetical protein
MTKHNKSAILLERFFIMLLVLVAVSGVTWAIYAAVTKTIAQTSCKSYQKLDASNNCVTSCPSTGEYYSPAGKCEACADGTTTTDDGNVCGSDCTTPEKKCGSDCFAPSGIMGCIDDETCMNTTDLQQLPTGYTPDMANAKCCAAGYHQDKKGDDICCKSHETYNPVFKNCETCKGTVCGGQCYNGPGICCGSETVGTFHDDAKPDVDTCVGTQICEKKNVSAYDNACCKVMVGDRCCDGPSQVTQDGKCVTTCGDAYCDTRSKDSPTVCATGPDGAKSCIAATCVIPDGVEGVSYTPSEYKIPNSSGTHTSDSIFACNTDVDGVLAVCNGEGGALCSTETGKVSTIEFPAPHAKCNVHDCVEIAKALGHGALTNATYNADTGVCKGTLADTSIDIVGRKCSGTGDTLAKLRAATTAKSVCRVGNSPTGAITGNVCVDQHEICTVNSNNVPSCGVGFTVALESLKGATSDITTPELLKPIGRGLVIRAWDKTLDGARENVSRFASATEAQQFIANVACPLGYVRIAVPDHPTTYRCYRQGFYPGWNPGSYNTYGKEGDPCQDSNNTPMRIPNDRLQHTMFGATKIQGCKETVPINAGAMYCSTVSSDPSANPLLSLQQSSNNIVDWKLCTDPKGCVNPTVFGFSNKAGPEGTSTVPNGNYSRTGITYCGEPHTYVGGKPPVSIDTRIDKTKNVITNDPVFIKGGRTIAALSAPNMARADVCATVMGNDAILDRATIHEIKKSPGGRDGTVPKHVCAADEAQRVVLYGGDEEVVTCCAKQRMDGATWCEDAAVSWGDTVGGMKYSGDGIAQTNDRYGPAPDTTSVNSYGHGVCYAKLKTPHGQSQSGMALTAAQYKTMFPSTLLANSTLLYAGSYQPYINENAKKTGGDTSVFGAGLPYRSTNTTW